MALFFGEEYKIKSLKKDDIRPTSLFIRSAKVHINQKI